MRAGGDIDFMRDAMQLVLQELIDLSRICVELDVAVGEFRERRLDHIEFPLSMPPSGSAWSAVGATSS